MRFCSFRSADALACDPASETLSAGGKTHVVAETRDAFGRGTGYAYAKAGTVQQTTGVSYAETTGRIATASFVHGGAQKTFSYAYLAGTSLVQTLTCPNNMTETRSYEAARNLLSGIAYKRGTTLVSQRTYVRDALGRPLTRSTARNGTTRNDAFGYNNRSELTSATLGNDEYAYAFDNIGNRNTASETGSALAYSTNNLNQYASIGENEGNAFVPGYDADGNATSIQTSTGTWSVEYNGANRPVRFRNEESDTTIECGYDSQGRRCFKKVTVAGTVTLHHRYIYRGYLQIACVDLTRSGHPALWFVLWDPSQETATRPLAIQKDGTWYTYGCDITKNVCEVFGPAGYIRTSYSYAPFGAVSASGNVTQPFQWSSEHYDSETALVYYNFRHYSPDLGRWLSRDPIEEKGGWNLYAFVKNRSIDVIDKQGKISIMTVTGPDYDVSPNASCCLEEKPIWKAEGYSSLSECMDKKSTFGEYFGFMCTTLCALQSKEMGIASGVLGVGFLIGDMMGGHLVCGAKVCTKMKSPVRNIRWVQRPTERVGYVYWSCPDKTLSR